MLKAIDRLLRSARRLLPALLGLFLILFSLVPVGAPNLSGIMPLFSVMAIYYWSIYRPDLMPGWAAFSLGLLQDILDRKSVV